MARLDSNSINFIRCGILADQSRLFSLQLEELSLFKDRGSENIQTTVALLSLMRKARQTQRSFG